ncbi:MAG: LuxR C-terminal-related transcriptional regulator [Prosthecobacter sp.]
METHRRIRVLLVDSDYIARCGVAVALQQEPDIEVVGQAKDESRACLCPKDSLDVILFGAHTDSSDMESSFHDARCLSRHARVLVYGGDHTEEHVHNAVGAGVFGYLCRHSKRRVFVDAVRRVASGHRYFPDEIQALLQARRIRKELSAREVTMLELIAEGLSNKEMAAHLQVSPETVKFHVGNVIEKLEARDRTHALVIALRRGITRLVTRPGESVANER